MSITLHARRFARSFRAHRAPHPPRGGVLVVEHEFEGGPFSGRRMTGIASTVDMPLVRSPRVRTKPELASSHGRSLDAPFERAMTSVGTRHRKCIARSFPCVIAGSAYHGFLPSPRGVPWSTSMLPHRTPATRSAIASHVT